MADLVAGSMVVHRMALTTKEAADRIRYWAKLNFKPIHMSYALFMDLANELDPKEGADTVPAEPVVSQEIAS